MMRAPVGITRPSAMTKGAAAEVERECARAHSMVVQIADKDQFGDIAISISIFRQSKRGEVGKFDMRIDARYLGGPGVLQKQSVGLGNRAAELKAIPSYRAL